VLAEGHAEVVNFETVDATIAVANNTAPAGSGVRVTGGSVVSGNGHNSWDRGASDDRGDAGRTLVANTDYAVQRFATTLTANRTVTLSTTGAGRGCRFRVVRTGLGAFTLDVGGLKTIPSATAAFVDVEHDGTSWRLAAYGAL
jgi:hypothetical protein